ncbi:MAG: hypothetical protein K9G62_08290 [Alphaproteobacteria bacterium]|nr:hypothetical protein [Alphaproteobacteria bacterium]
MDSLASTKTRHARIAASLINRLRWPEINGNRVPDNSPKIAFPELLQTGTTSARPVVYISEAGQEQYSDLTSAFLSAGSIEISARDKRISVPILAMAR